MSGAAPAALSQPCPRQRHPSVWMSRGDPHRPRAPRGCGNAYSGPGSVGSGRGHPFSPWKRAFRSRCWFLHRLVHGEQRETEESQAAPDGYVAGLIRELKTPILVSQEEYVSALPARILTVSAEAFAGSGSGSITTQSRWSQHHRSPKAVSETRLPLGEWRAGQDRGASRCAGPARWAARSRVLSTTSFSRGRGSRSPAFGSIPHPQGL